MLKRESERLVEPLPGVFFHLPILHVLLWFYSLYENSCDFFFKCAVHISLTELIKGNECFKSTSAFLIYRDQTPGLLLRSVHINRLLFNLFPLWITLPLPLLFHTHGWISARRQHAPSVFYLVAFQTAKAEVAISIMRSDLELYQMD